MPHSLLNPLPAIPHRTKLPKTLHSNSSLFKRFCSCSPILTRKDRRCRCRESSAIVVASEKTMDDGFYMRRCVELARTAIGHTAPNPMVGCVIVNCGGEIVGEGFHPKAGQPHAEVFALRDAGSLAENATAYVSLEPCNHYGRTPPCTEALIRSKVRQVVVGMVDPNPIVASKGVEKLRASGIDVTVGVEEMLCQKLNEAYIHRMLTGKPFVTLRYSMSFDGRILNHLGEGAGKSGGYYSKLLQEYDGIVSSSNLSARASMLSASHETGASQPLQIIIPRGESSSLSLPGSITESAARIVVLTDKAITIEPKFESLEVVTLEWLNLSSILDYCGKQGLCSIILDFRGDYESLSDLLEDGLNVNLVQKVVMELCPVLDGNEQPSNLKFGRKLLRLKDLQSTASNESVIVEGYISLICGIHYSMFLKIFTMKAIQ